MNHQKAFIRLSLIALLTWAVIGTAIAASVSSRMSTRFLARGEQALLEVAIVGAQPISYPEIAPVEGVNIQASSRSPYPQRTPGQLVEYVYPYIVTSYEVGRHRIEPIALRVGSQTLMTESIDFSVFNPEDLEWSTATVGDVEFNYASAFKVLEDQPYVNESVPVEIKLYLPRNLRVIDWGIPDFKREGLTAWRMQPKQMRGQTNLLGQPYTAVSYPSTLTPNRSGEISIGPASIRLISEQFLTDGIPRRVRLESQIQIPQLALQAKPLPPNAPSGFANAVGKFNIRANVEETEVVEGDPLSVEISVSGSGNLDILRPPQLVSSLGWKTYEATRQQRGEERREINGKVTFQQFIRPLELKSQVPAYRLVFFNPETESYESVETEPIALQMTPAPPSTAGAIGPPPAADTPIEQMSDILGLIPNSQLTRSGSFHFSQWWLHTLGAIAALSLILRALWLRFGHKLQSNPLRRQQLEELKRIEGIRDDDRQFLMASGRFVERWLGGKSDSEIAEILSERDSHCFRRGESAISIGKDRRRSILTALRQHSGAILVAAACLLLSSTTLRAENANQSAVEAYESARYDQAIETWLQAAPYSELSADTLYHIGNACYRAGSSGHAALYYRRALLRDSQHIEARQNLRFIERKYGALTIKRPDHQHLLARLPLNVWQTCTWAGIWLCVLGALCFPATRRGAKLRYFAITAIIVSPLLAVGSGLGWRYYPTDAVFAPIHKQAVIVSSGSQLHNEASRNSSVVIDPPPGSLCEVLYQSGEWSYVSFATQTRGWMPSTHIKPIIPDGTPETPKINKPVADETSA